MEIRKTQLDTVLSIDLVLSRGGTGRSPEVLSTLGQSVSLRFIFEAFEEPSFVPRETVLHSRGPGWICGPVQGPCFAVELSVSLQTRMTRRHIPYDCVANNPSNLAAGIAFSHMLYFFKYSFVLPSCPHRSQTFDTQIPLKSILISLNTFTTSGLKGPKVASYPIQLSKHFSSSPFHGTGVSLGSRPTKRSAVSSSPSHN